MWEDRRPPAVLHRRIERIFNKGRVFMNRICIVLFLLAIVPAAVGQGIDLDTDKKRFSYAVGLQIGQSLIRQGVELDPTVFALAVRDAVDGSKPRLSPEEMTAILKTQETKTRDDIRKAAAANLEKGQAFMAENKNQEGVVALSNGLQYKVLRKGAGEQPTKSDTVTVHYTGTLIDGREFDSSKRRGEPATFPLNGVIKGWQEILPLMRVGSRWHVVIPPDLAYGAKGAGAVIGPNETLLFEIELLDIPK
jgi:FKBP-type peptidyl-prolyl cis-trans isomerase FklB